MLSTGSSREGRRARDDDLQNILPLKEAFINSQM
jgi:hypothetical protein